MEKYGYIYALKNNSFGENIIKIGKTERNPLERAEELSKPSSIPTPFYVLCYIKVNKLDEAENFIHSLLKMNRSSENREFFKIDYKDLRMAMIETAEKYRDKRFEAIKSELNRLYEIKTELDESIKELSDQLEDNFDFESDEFIKGCQPDYITTEFQLDIPRDLYERIDSQGKSIDIEMYRAFIEKYNWESKKTT